MPRRVSARNVIEPYAGSCLGSKTSDVARDSYYIKSIRSPVERRFIRAVEVLYF